MYPRSPSCAWTTNEHKEVHRRRLHQVTDETHRESVPQCVLTSHQKSSPMLNLHRSSKYAVLLRPPSFHQFNTTLEFSCLVT